MGFLANRYLWNIGEELSDLITITSIQISAPEFWASDLPDPRAIYTPRKKDDKIIHARVYDDQTVASWVCNSPHLFNHPEELRKLESPLFELLKRGVYLHGDAARIIARNYKS